MPKTMALLAVALSRPLPHGLTVDVIEVELNGGVLTNEHLNTLGKNLLEDSDNFEIRIWDMGKRANIRNTLTTGETEDLQVYVFHSQSLDMPIIQ